MSRYTLMARPPYHYCVVGFDPPLGTFFAQVYRRRRPQHPSSLVHWIGTDLNEIPIVEALTAALAPYVTVPEEIQQQLARDGHVGFQPNFGARLRHALWHHDTEASRGHSVWVSGSATGVEASRPFIFLHHNHTWAHVIRRRRQRVSLISAPEEDTHGNHPSHHRCYSHNGA